MNNLPKNFLRGGATTTNQYEGRRDAEGRGPIKTDIMTVGTANTTRILTYRMPGGATSTVSQLEGTPEGGKGAILDDYYYPNQEGTDFYHRYKEDITLFAKMGFKMFRMLISWLRIFPQGIEHEPNQDGLNLYRNVFIELKKFHIEPLVTISHYDTPFYLEGEEGGWNERKMIAYFDHYTEVISKECKGLARYWLTFSEINCLIMMKDWMSNATGETVSSCYQQLRCQFAASIRAMQRTHGTDPDYQAGCMLAGMYNCPLTCDPEDILKTQKKIQDAFYYCGDVMMRGRYPAYAKRIWKEDCVELDCTLKDVQQLEKGTVDFFTFSYYGTNYVMTHEGVEKDGADNLNLDVKNKYIQYIDWGRGMDPDGLQYFLNDIYDRYEIPVMAVESGLGTTDTLKKDGSIHDLYRIGYLHERIRAMHATLKDGMDLRDYTPWGCIDLISVPTDEMEERYGFIYIDLDSEGNGTKNRYKKDSFYWYKKMIASNGEDLGQQRIFQFEVGLKDLFIRNDMRLL